MTHGHRFASNVLFVGLLLIFFGAFLPTDAADAAKSCKFACQSPDGSVSEPTSDVGLSGLPCDDDSECAARCTATCGEPAAARRTCATSPAPTCVENAEPAAAPEPGPSESPPATRTPGEFGYVNPLGTVDLDEVLGRIIRTVLGFVGALFLAMFVYGGTQWMLAGGDAKKVESGRKTLINAVIGMVVIAISYSVISIIFETASVIRGG